MKSDGKSDSQATTDNKSRRLAVPSSIKRSLTLKMKRDLEETSKTFDDTEEDNLVETTNDHDLTVPSAPSKPHPSLEYPPLYFVLHWFPWLREKIVALYAWRWSASYPLQKRIVGSKLLRKFKIHLTYGEVLTFIPLALLALVCIYQTFVVPSVSGTGKAARLSVVAALLFAQKNSYLTMVLGIPFDRAVAYHKMSGYVTVITGIMHAVAYYLDDENHKDSNPTTTEEKGSGGQIGNIFNENPEGSSNSTTSDESVGSEGFSIENRLSELVQDSMNISGTVILGSIMLIFLSSLPWVRTKLFEVFYFIHLTLLMGIIGGTAVHTGFMVPLLVFLITGIDFIIRKLLMPYRYPKEATLRVISESLVEIKFPKVKGFDYNPGQYIYICIPELSRFEWHPFSLCSAPHQSHVLMQIRVAGNWTAALRKLALEKSTVPIMIEGPYGNVGVDMTNDNRYKVVLLLSGGIGCTF